MTIEVAERKKVLVGIKFDCHGRELLNWALVKVADPGDHVIAIHVSRGSDSTSKDKSLLDGYLEVYQGLCHAKNVDLTGEVLRGSSIRKVIVKEAQNRAAVAVVVGTSGENSIGSWTSIANYCSKRLPKNIDVLAIHNGNVVFTRSSSSLSPGLKEEPRPSFLRLLENPTFRDIRSPEMRRHSHEVIQRCGDGGGDISKITQMKKALSLNSAAVYAEECESQRPGWPLLRSATPVTPLAEEARKMSVVQWVMTLPSRTPSPPETPESGSGSSSKRLESLLRLESKASTEENDMSPSKHIGLLEDLDKIMKRNSCDPKWFTFDVMEASTSNFSPDNLIGKGGCCRVYKGILPDGNSVAVKVLKLSKEASKDFVREVDVMTSLKHKNVAALLGICVEEDELISVYDFFSGGNLEEKLHGYSKESASLTWQERFKIGIRVAETLNYLHEECSRPVIHRDVKSSNILLSDELEPQISDFGLAIWGPTASPFLIDHDVVGTFGYLAPEYFMFGKVSAKVDVYSFGVVLLELLSGKKPINSETEKVQESLVMWAKMKLETGNVSSLMDPKMGGNVDEDQVQRIAIAARLCLTRSARLRPRMSQIVKILKGVEDIDDWVKTQFEDQKEAEKQESTDDEVYPHLSTESHLGLAMLDVEEDTTSFSSAEQSSGISSEGWSRSSSLD